MEFQLGDYVFLVFIGECGECCYCKFEESNMCDLLRMNFYKGVMLSDGKFWFIFKGNLVYYFIGIFIFIEYIVVYAGCFVKIN